MADIAKEIMEFAKLKDRPSPWELRVSNAGIFASVATIKVTITTPVEGGRFVWKVNDIAAYDAGSIDSIVTLLLGVHRRHGCLYLYLYPSGATTAIAEWQISGNSPEETKKAIREALSVLKTAN